MEKVKYGGQVYDLVPAWYYTHQIGKFRPFVGLF